MPGVFVPVRAGLAVVMVLALAGCGDEAPARPAAAANPGATATTAGPAGTGRLGAGPTPTATPRPVAGGRCPILPADHALRTPVTGLPVHRSSAAYVASIGTDRPLKADFGAGQWEGAPIGIPVTTVPPGQPGVKVSFGYADESDRGPYPVPRNARIEGGPSSDGDRHVLVYDTGRCRLYELYVARPQGDGSWRADAGAVFDLRSNKLRPAGWTSADAAGLPIMPTLVRYEEVAAGRIDHAIRITVPRTRTGYLWPARHSATSETDPALPQMGLRLRLKAGVNIARLPRQARVIAEAMRTYGVIVADHGSAWFVSGAPDDRWSNDALRALGTLRGADFEAVDASGLMLDRNSAAARG
jgi:hypothetical protein